MHHEVAGYVLGEALYDIEGFVTYRARQLKGGGSVLVRGSRREFSAPAEAHRLQHELELLSAGGEVLPGVLTPLQRLDDNRNSYLVYDSFAGLPLQEATRDARWAFHDFVVAARALLSALAGCHARGIVHCTVSPHTVLWDTARRELRLAHFVHARGPMRAPPGGPGPSLSAFSAPEQTGQLSAGIDQRSDLYSAGAVFYWMLTGQAPIPNTLQSAELVHSLVARQPLAVTQLRADAPRGVAEFVMRLLAKSPGERSPTANEALEELELAAAQLGGPMSARSSSAPPLGAARLQGRSEELAVLRRALEETAAGAMRVVFVGGAPGSGKSRLTDELRDSLARDRYLVASGKFEQYRQHRPYSALLAAMSQLFDVFLSASEDALDYWRERFERVDANLRAVLAEQIPQLHHIVEQHPPPPRLGPAETQNRFQQAFRALLDALCDSEHPLVLTVDDLQWSDAETLALLSESFIKSRKAYLLLILAYRPKEAAAAPRVKELIEQHGPGKDDYRHMELEQLSGDDIVSLCNDIVSPCPENVQLGALVERECHGNPLYALEIIKYLRQTGGLKWTAGAEGGAWRFEPVAARSAAPDNVVDFIVSRIGALPEASRLAVVAASCLGHVFDLASLELATGLSASVLRVGIAAAMAEGMIVSDSPPAAAWSAGAVPAPESRGELKFSFYHDRIQQAAYSLCSQSERERLHLVIGRALAQRAADTQTDLFAAVEHLNEVDSLLEPAERAQLARLDVQAGRLAKEIVAYRTATALFEKALAIVPAPESDSRRLRFEALLELGESRYLCAEFELAEQAFEQALLTAEVAAEEVAVHRTRLVLYQHQQRYQEAIALGLRALSLLGVRMSQQPSPPRLASSLAATMLKVRGLKIEDLREKPDRASDLDRLILDLLVLLWTPCFWTNPKLCALVVLRLIDRTMALGNTSQAPMAYVCFAILNHVLLKRHERALEFGNLALGLLSAETAPFIASRVRFLALTFFGSLQRDNRSNVEAYEQALTSCLGSGEHVFAGHTIDGITTSLPIHGFRIPDIERRLDACRLVAERISSQPSIELIGVIRAWCRALVEGPDAAAASIDVGQLRFDSYVGVHSMLRMATLYLWDDDDRVLELWKTLRGNVVIQSNPLHASFYALFAALSLCRSRRRGSRRAIRALVAKVARFERIFSPNFRSVLLCLRAEAARYGGDGEAALEFYHRAIAEASERGHDLVHAIACERLAGLYEMRADAQGHLEYLRIAALSYGRFGAAAKVARLASRYPGVALTEGEQPLTSGQQLVDLRAEAVMRAAYAIAEEARSDRLAHTLLSVVTTAAGAQRAFLLKPDALKWMILASWSSDQQGGSFEPSPLDGSKLLSEGAVRYVARTRSSLHIHDAQDPRYKEDPYLSDKRPRSVLCLPLLHRGELLAVLYLENSVCADVFTNEQRQLAVMLGHQAAIAMAIADYHKVQLDALQAKINPHFLHNSLSVIADLVVSQPGNAEAAILKLSKLYRYVLNSSAVQVVSLEKEIEITRDYLTLEQYRFKDRLRVHWDVRGATGQVRVPALILQPLVENAVRHGVGPKVEGGTVSIEVDVGAASCRLRVSDDGAGWRPGKAGSGFGLRSVVDRLKILYRDAFEFSIDKGEGGVCIDIRFPLRSVPSGVRIPSDGPKPAALQEPV